MARFASEDANKNNKNIVTSDSRPLTLSRLRVYRLSTVACTADVCGLLSGRAPATQVAHQARRTDLHHRADPALDRYLR